jgi:hypothetical protein
VGAVIFVLIVVGIVGFFVWQFTATKNALATTSVQSPYSPEETRQIVDSAFGGARAMLWTSENGPGTINRRRRGKGQGITMSVTIECGADGGSQVDMWASRYNEYFGFLANFAGSVNSRKKAIERALKV